jgi:hypothetical protein
MYKMDATVGGAECTSQSNKKGKKKQRKTNKGASLLSSENSNSKIQSSSPLLPSAREQTMFPEVHKPVVAPSSIPPSYKASLESWKESKPTLHQYPHNLIQVVYHTECGDTLKDRCPESEKSKQKQKKKCPQHCTDSGMDPSKIPVEKVIRNEF